MTTNTLFSDDVLRVCLSLYMEGQGRTLPLPTENEVLLCTEQTRYEEVELLLRRALGMHQNGKLFCLVNADRLSYDVGVKVEKFYELDSPSATGTSCTFRCFQLILRAPRPFTALL